MSEQYRNAPHERFVPTDAFHREKQAHDLFVYDLASRLKECVSELIQQHLTTSMVISEAVKERCLAWHADALRVEVHTDLRDIVSRLHDVDYLERIPELMREDALLVIHLPLAARFRRGWVNNPPQNSLEVFAHIYDQVIDALWNEAREFCSRCGYVISRLNAPGEHKDGKDGFYYLWVVSPSSSGGIHWVEKGVAPEESEYE